MTVFTVERLGDLTEPVASWTPTRSPDKHFDYIDLSSVDQNKKVVTGATRVKTNVAPSRARQLVSAGDVLVSTVRPNLNGVAVVPEDLDGATASTGFTVLRPGSRLDGRYLFHWVRTDQFIGAMMRNATGASYPAVSDKIVKASSIPLPLLEEQRRIAAILDQADAVRAKRCEALAHLDDLTQSIFLDMFGDPLGRDIDARAVPLSELVDRVTYGFTSPMKHVEDGIPIITAKNVAGGAINFGDCKYGTKSEFDALTDKSKPRPGDILVTKDGSIGRCAVVPQVAEFCINQSVALLRPRLDLVHPRWLMGFLTTDRVQAVMSGMSKGNALKHLQITELAGLPILHAGESAQVKYVEHVRMVQALGTSGREQFADLDRLFASLQSRAFAGAL